MISVPAGKSLALASLTLLDNSDPDSDVDGARSQLETAAPSSGGQLGGAISQFAHLTLALGTNLPIAFPVPLVLSSPPGEAFVFRAIIVEQRVVSSYEVNILAVGLHLLNAGSVMNPAPRGPLTSFPSPVSGFR